jgi:hypothetical protein
MKPPVPENPDQNNVITGHILLSFGWSSGQSWRTRRATPRPDLPCWAQRSVAAECPSLQRCCGTVRGPRLHRRELSISDRAVVRLLYQPGHVGPPGPISVESAMPRS